MFCEVIGLAVKFNGYIYPYTEQVKKLPVYVTGIGGTELQGHIKRASEGCWDQILFCVGGSGCLKFDNETVSISSGDIFFMPRGKAHEYFPCEKKWDVRWLVFDGLGIEDLKNELGLTKPIVVKSEDLSSLQNLFDRMFITLKADRVYGNYLCSGLVYQFIMEFHRMVLSVPNANVKNEILIPVLNYIEDNFRKDFSVSELAAVSGVSQQYMGRLFKQTMNISPEKYIICRRIGESKQLLLETDKSIAEISKMCGFSGSGYFSTVFRRSEGVSPSEYRKNGKA